MIVTHINYPDLAIKIAQIQAQGSTFFTCSCNYIEAKPFKPHINTQILPTGLQTLLCK